MTVSYYFWKWADNDLPGRPMEVLADLLRGEWPRALQIFDARPLLKKLEKSAARGRKVDEEWDWRVEPPAGPRQAKFVFATCPAPDTSEKRMRQFCADFQSLGLSGCDENSGLIIPGFGAKLNSFLSGQRPWERAYDITVADLPQVIKSIDPRERAPFGILEGRGSWFVQCYAEGRRFVVEWAQNQYHPIEIYDQWRAMDPSRLAAQGGRVEEEKVPGSKDPDLLRYADVLNIFGDFITGKPRPAKYAWRNINHLIHGA